MVGSTQTEESGDVHAAARRTGRRQGVSSTRRDIIRSAQKLFAERGYRGATTRAIARDAQVDSALIHHFFATKEGVFVAAIADAFQPDAILESVLVPGPGTVGERLIRSILLLWDEPETRDPMQAMVRSAVSHDSAARLVSDFVTKQVIGQVVDVNATSHKALRTTLIGTQVIGMLMVRYMIGIEPLASLAPDAVVSLIGPVVDHYLSEDLDAAQKPEFTGMVSAINRDRD